MDDAPTGAGLPPGLRFLKALVIALTVTMIAGVITIVALLVTRLPTAWRAGPAIPASIALPDGARAVAFTRGDGWSAVVTTDDRILVFNPDGTLRQEIRVTSAP